MSNREQAATIVLLEDAKHGWSSVADAIEERGSALAVLDESDSGQTRLFDTGTPIDERLNQALARIDAWEREGIHFVSVLDNDYPAQLLTIHQRPPFTTWRGTLDPVDARGVGIVGTRQASPSGLAMARALAGGLRNAAHRSLAAERLGSIPPPSLPRWTLAAGLSQ